MKYLLLSVILLICSCVHDPQSQPKYDVGDCAMVIDKKSGMKNSKYFVRIEDIKTIKTVKDENTYYIFRWWLGPKVGWSCCKITANEILLLRSDVQRIYQFEVFETISKKATCPKEPSLD